ncbi:hypothetical protein L2E82_10444 [Cichorium intybus]|uniref:Uncharacterized protein n=1 Tax=Cichorium intybus TaxID=13427 RepID=A0ACB9GB87_CICIN|nr:hypothetical protein L2E82_10444 [Cichorium intybus]
MHISLIYSSISNPILVFLFSIDGVFGAPTKSTSEHSRVPARTKERLQKTTSYSASPSPLFLRGFHLYPWALTKENLILLEAWKTTDGAYVDYGEQTYGLFLELLVEYNAIEVVVSIYKSDDSRTCAKKGLIALEYYKILELYFTLLIRVMAVTVHKFGDYFPGTGDIRDIGYSKDVLHIDLSKQSWTAPYGITDTCYGELYLKLLMSWWIKLI